MYKPRMLKITNNLMEHIKKDQEYDQDLKKWIKQIAQGKENEFRESDGEILRFKDI